MKKQVSQYSINHKVNSFPSHLLPQLKDFLVKVGEKLTLSFLNISPLNFIDNFIVEYDEKNVLALQIKIVLKNKQICAPQQILSEANLDLLALLFFISFIQESSERGQAKFLIIDDVLQSVDATIRISFISFLLKNFREWQFIITAHDRLWYSQLTEQMKRYSHSYLGLSIVGWTFEDGPIIKTYSSERENLVKSIDDGDLISICSRSGLVLEELCDNLSISLSTSIKRKKDDKYTIADLWSGLSKELRNTDIKDKIEEVNKWLHLRNMIGAHYNENATALSLNDARSFGEAVLKLLDEVKCGHCKSWLTTNPAFNFYSCKCGKLRLNKK